MFSGELETASALTEAQIITYDYDLVEQDRWTVEAGLENTGYLWASPTEPNIVVGLTTDAPCKLYRMDVTTGTVTGLVSLGSVTVGGCSENDGFLYAAISEQLVRNDPVTLTRTTMLDMTAFDATAGLITWVGEDLYFTDDEELARSLEVRVAGSTTRIRPFRFRFTRSG